LYDQQQQREDFERKVHAMDLFDCFSGKSHSVHKEFAYNQFLFSVATLTSVSNKEP
jgi:hypothetical protein